MATEPFPLVDHDVAKVFVSRIPAVFDEDTVRRVLEKHLGRDTVTEVALKYPRNDENDEDRDNYYQGDKRGGDRYRDDDHTKPKTNHPEKVHTVSDDSDADNGQKDKDTGRVNIGRRGLDGEKQQPHRGFGFVTFLTPDIQAKALELGTVRGGVKETSTRKHTLYIRPVVREDDNGRNDDPRSETPSSKSTATAGAPSYSGKQVCFLWSKFRCPYGDKCKFVHEGEGGCVDNTKKDKDGPSGRKKIKCFAYKKGKCKLSAEECPYSHDFEVKTNTVPTKRDASEKDCINWKTKGKCRKRDTCPYRHDEEVRLAALAKIDKKKKKNQKKNKPVEKEDMCDGTNKEGYSKHDRQVGGDGETQGGWDNSDSMKQSQPLSIRVFGLNYETTEKDIREFFEGCGKIVEITFPTFDDSGRSKGYCGVLFQSPKAVAKAVELDGQELHGRWLRIQAGKMYLKRWNEQHKSRWEANKSGDGMAGGADMANAEPLVGEFGQRVKRRKRHGYGE